MTTSLFSQERDISAIFSGSFMVYPEKGNFFGNHAFSFQAGLSIWDTVKVFGEILLPENFKEIEKSPIERLAKYSIKLGIWNAMMGYKKHFNIQDAKGDVTNIDLHYDITRFADFGDIVFAGAYVGLIYQKYNNGISNYDGYGLSAYMDTTTLSLLSRSDYAKLDKFDFIPWCKFGFAYTLGPNHYYEYPVSISYMVSWDVILGLGFIYNGFIPVCFSIGYNLAAYASDMFKGAPDNISRNEGLIANITLKF